MTDRIIQISDNFWNIRGTFRIGGVVNIGTQASLLRRDDGRFILLDAYTLKGDVKREVDALTDGGSAIDAIINLHPFHTVHAEAGHAQFPKAKLYGTRRHLENFPGLPWEAELSESPDCAALFADDLQFSVPAGVDFVSPNPHLHFSSVLAYHPSSRTIHVDDTLMLLKLPGPVGRMLPTELRFHPTLAQTLERRAGAVDDFESWVRTMTGAWADAENLCAAHNGTLRGCESGEIGKRVERALRKVGRTLRAHRKKFD